jgi:Mg-chelatase subunit ChlD
MTFPRILRTSALLVLALPMVWLAAGCGASRLETPGSGNGSDPTPAGGGAGGAGAGGPAPAFKLPDAAPPRAAEPDADSCGAESHEATRVPVDLLLLVDVSSSMANVVAGGTRSKWDIAREALLAFLSDPRSQGLNIAMQFFPLGASCAVADYQTAAVPFAELPGVLPALTGALTTARLSSGTPTGVAVTGALDHLRARLQASPDHRGRLLLITDGEPTACTPLFIDQIAVPVADALAGTPSIPTHVIGVFTPAELTRAQSTVARLATAGGTTAVLLDANADLPTRLNEALSEIRSIALPCEFSIPRPRLDNIDYGRVNVHVATAAGGRDIPYVRTADRCDPATGGWYYDSDPATARPTRVVICDSTCRAFRSDPRTRVDLRFGCRTLVVN